MRKRMLSLILVVALFLSLALTAGAYEVLDFSRKGSISIAMTHNGRPVAGGSLTLYRVADVVDQNGDSVFVYTDDFSECTISVTELDSAQLPEELARIAAAKRLTGTTRELDRQGQTKFSDLEIGLYLVVQKQPAPGYTKIKPFLVSVPQNEDGQYVYDVDTAPKNIPEPEKEPTKPTRPTEPTKPKEDHLPQTGQTNWPVPAMAAAGVLLVAAGVCFVIAGKRKEHET